MNAMTMYMAKANRTTYNWFLSTLRNIVYIIKPAKMRIVPVKSFIWVIYNYKRIYGWDGIGVAIYLTEMFDDFNGVIPYRGDSDS